VWYNLSDIKILLYSIFCPLFRATISFSTALQRRVPASPTDWYQSGHPFRLPDCPVSRLGTQLFRDSTGAGRRKDYWCRAIWRKKGEECVRCLTEFLQPLTTSFNELYAFSHRSVSESGLILPEDANIDLEPLVREYLLIEVPINPICRPDCKGLCVVCGEDLNQTTCEHVTHSV
jgi:hypothetical protein